MPNEDQESNPTRAQREAIWNDPYVRMPGHVAGHLPLNATLCTGKRVRAPILDRASGEVVVRPVKAEEDQDLALPEPNDLVAIQGRALKGERTPKIEWPDPAPVRSKKKRGASA